MPTPTPHAPPAPADGPALDRVAVLERTIGASLERIWENVLDWEHLPWLHRDSFASIDLEEAGDWGWRARAASTSRPDESFVVEVRIEPEVRRYVSRTVAGAGAGTEIRTFLEPLSHDATAIRVEFWVPGIPEAAREKVGAGYLRLYRKLWDEDESMMRERGARLVERARGARPEVPRVAELGAREDLLRRLPTCVELGGARWRLVDVGGEILVHDARCPHLFGPLEEGPEAGVPEGEVRCPWHGYRFDVRTGGSSDGRRLRLRTPPRVEHDPVEDALRLVLD